MEKRRVTYESQRAPGHSIFLRSKKNELLQLSSLSYKFIPTSLFSLTFIALDKQFLLAPNQILDYHLPRLTLPLTSLSPASALWTSSSKTINTFILKNKTKQTTTSRGCVTSLHNHMASKLFKRSLSIQLLLSFLHWHLIWFVSALDITDHSSDALLVIMFMPIQNNAITFSFPSSVVSF